MKKTILVLMLVFSAFCLAQTSSAYEIIPLEYTFDKGTDRGSYSYHDWTQNQLIDGQYGTAPWSANLGNGNAYEWVGWSNDAVVNIDFTFSGVTDIDDIHVGTVQDHINDVVLPTVTIYAWSESAWSQVAYMSNPESYLNDNTYFTLTFTDLDIFSDKVRVTLSHSLNGPWTFTDEIDFYSDGVVGDPVPVPGTLMLLFAGLLGVAGLSKRS